MRLATFNILHGRSPSDDRVDLGRFVEAVESLDADVLALQEVDRNQPRSSGADLTALAAEAMGAPEHQFVAALSGSPGATWMAADGSEQPDATAYGIALLSRHPVRSWQVIRLAPAPVRVPRVLIGQRTMELSRDEPRVAVAAAVDAPHGPITIVTTHLTYLRWWNRRQLKVLLSSLSRVALPSVLMGDLNMGQARAEHLSAMTSLVTSATFPADQPHSQLDHILGSQDLRERVAGGRAHKLPLSDHLALSVDLR